jgi:hypothetical protein
MKITDEKENVFKTMEIDIDSITKDIYQNMTRDQRGVLLWMLSSKDFDCAISSARKKLNIPDGGWSNPFICENYYGNSLEKNRQGYTETEIKIHNNFEKKLVQTTQIVLNTFGLDRSWFDTLSNLIRFCKFTPPEKYKIHLNPKFLNPTIEINYIAKSSNDFIKWVKLNWPLFPKNTTTEWFNELETNNECQNKKIKTIPQYSNLRDYIKMLRLKNVYQFSYSKVAHEVNDEDKKRVANTIQNIKKTISHSKKISNNKQNLIERMSRL